jgi:hypothetical protein
MGDLGRAEVADLDVVALGKQDVRGLDVAMDHAVLERVVERAAHLEDHQHRLAHRQEVRLRAKLLERAARHVLHHDVALVPLDHRVVHADDVGVVQLAGERGLVQEQLLEALGFLLAHLGVALRDLHGDLAVVERVLGEVHEGRGALAQLGQDAVLADLGGAV